MNEKLGLTSDETYVDQVDPQAQLQAAKEAKKQDGAKLFVYIHFSYGTAPAEGQEIDAEEILAIPDNCPNCTVWFS